VNICIEKPDVKVGSQIVLSGPMVRHVHTHVTIEGMPRAGIRLRGSDLQKQGRPAPQARRPGLDCLARISEAKAPGRPVHAESVETPFSVSLIPENAIGRRLPFPLTAWDVATVTRFLSDSAAWGHHEAPFPRQERGQIRALSLFPV